MAAAVDRPPMHVNIGELDNWDRAEMARTTVQQFNYEYYHSESDRDLDIEEVRHMVVGDFLADMLHWLGKEQFSLLLERGVAYYDDELAEEDDEDLDVLTTEIGDAP